MSMSKVTLLGAPGRTYTIMHHEKSYSFSAGHSRKVPQVIALVAKKRHDAKGNAFFRVEELPETVTNGGKTQSKKLKGPKEQNVSTEAQQQTL